MAPDPRELLTAYRDALKGARKSAGPAGALIAPFQVTADLLDELLRRQETLETRFDEVVKQFEAVVQLARDAPASLRTQSAAFSAAAVALEQAAEVMSVQADLLEQAGSVIDAPARVVKRKR